MRWTLKAAKKVIRKIKENEKDSLKDFDWGDSDGVQ
jgi:hypothetical protein